jgi:hypothetical protein
MLIHEEFPKEIGRNPQALLSLAELTPFHQEYFLIILVF